MFNVGAPEVLVIMIVALVVLGPNKMPEAARQAGRWLSEFRKVSQGFQREMRAAMDEVSEPVRSTHALLKDGGDATPPGAGTASTPTLDKSSPATPATPASPPSPSPTSPEPSAHPGGQSWLAKPGDAAADAAGDAPA